MSILFNLRKAYKTLSLTKPRFTIRDVLRGENITIDDVLIGSTREEKEKAIGWLCELRDVEIKNVIGSLATLLGVQDYANKIHPENPLGFSMIAVGTSLTPPYTDIDLFMVPETFEHGKEIQYYGALQKPLTRMGEILQGRTLNEDWEGFNCLFSFCDYERGKTLGKDKEKYGSLIQMSLLANKFDFEFPREGREGDIIYRPTLDAEELIELNRRNGTKMAVLLRSYVFAKDYSDTTRGDLKVDSGDVTARYRGDVFLYACDSTGYYIKTLNEVFERTLAEQKKYGGEEVLTPLELRKQLRDRAYSLLEELDKTHRTDKFLCLPFKYYIDSLINQKVKAQFNIE